MGSSVARVATIKITVMNRDINIEGEGIERLSGAIIQKIEFLLKRQVRIARRTVIRESRVDNTPAESPIPAIVDESDVERSEAIDALTQMFEDFVEDTIDKSPEVKDNPILKQLGITK